MPGADGDRARRACDLELLTEAAREASVLALSYFGHNPEVWTKANNSPVSEADIAVDRRLAEILRAARPVYGWLSEETDDDASRLDKERVFVVDPIDGTREFLAGGREWTISVAVVEAGRPTVAVLAAPVLGKTYTAVAGEGARLSDRGAIEVTARRTLKGARLAGPRPLLRPVAAAADVPVTSIRFVGSLAYRLALAAEGAVDIAVGKEGARDWDVAAADLLVEEAGGSLTDLAGQRLRYNGAETRHPAIIAAPQHLRSEASRLIRQHLEALADSPTGP